MCPLVKEFQKHPNEFETIVCVTGQHREMLDQVLTIFDVKPDYDLNIMKQGQDLYDVTARVLTGMRDVFKECKPDVVLVHGDTTTSTAAALAAFYPKPVIVRMSDFKSNEYRKLLGGDIYEPEEENPMLGFRGASRYIAHSFRDCFELECIAMKKVRNELGLRNVEIMIPFVRTLEEASEVVHLLAAHGLRRGENDLRLIMMCEIPSNALMAEEFLQHFDGFSIGSNDLTQLTLGLDRDSGLVAHAFDERDPAVRKLLSMAIHTANRLGKYVGICGQGPSDHADFAHWLMDEGIQSLSLNPDTVVDTWLKLAATRQEENSSAA